MKDWREWAAFSISVILVPVLFSMNSRIDRNDEKRIEQGSRIRSDFQSEALRIRAEVQLFNERLSEKVDKLAQSQQEILLGVKQIQLDAVKEQLNDLKKNK